MVVSYPPFYPQQILDADGKPVAGGRILSFYAGTDVPLAMFAPDGTSLGSSVSIASDGTAVFCLKVGTPYKLVCADADGATIWVRDRVKVSAGEGGGMDNPMEAQGDLIVGGPDGDPLRLAPGADGDILATALSGGILSPKWEAGPKKYRNVYSNVPSPNINDGYLGCLFYLSGSAQALTLPATANVPSKSFIDFVFLDGTATLTITPQGTTTLNAQGSAVTIGGQAATLYRLTFLGHGGSGDEWALGGSGNGDHKVMVDGADDAPGYLIDKLYPGDGIAIEAVTDGDVRKVKISSTGGGGGGGVESAICAFPLMLCTSYKTNSNVSNAMVFIASRGGTPKHAQIYSIWNNGFSANIAAKLYTLDADGSNWVKAWECAATHFTATYPGKQCIQICKLPLTQTGSASVLEIGKQYMIAFSIANGAQNLYIPSYTNSWGQTAWVAKHLTNTSMPDTWGFISNASTEFWASDVIVE